MLQIRVPAATNTRVRVGDVGQDGQVSKYTFGDDRSALERLRLVAEAYDPVSRAFLATHAPQSAPLALDLGCGPAFSTQLLMDVCAPNAVIGIDGSAEFIQVARERLPEVRFETHDVTANPLPGAPAELIYSRLLLAHVPDPVAVAQGWLSQLLPGGILLVEDLEAVIDPPGPLREYEEVSTRIVRSGGGLMYAGAMLSDQGGEAHRVTVPGALAAKIYLFNVRRWRRDPTVPVSEDHLGELEERLVGVVGDDHGTTVSWVVRQLAYQA
jgi:trans-aconitate 2-methyltransferase